VPSTANRTRRAPWCRHGEDASAQRAVCPVGGREASLAPAPDATAETVYNSPQRLGEGRGYWPWAIRECWRALALRKRRPGFWRAEGGGGSVTVIAIGVHVGSQRRAQCSPPSPLWLVWLVRLWPDALCKFDADACATVIMSARHVIG
jgi:hypothetical protein